MRKLFICLPLAAIWIVGCSDAGVANSQEVLKPIGTPNPNKPVVGMGGASGAVNGDKAAGKAGKQ